MGGLPKPSDALFHHAGLNDTSSMRDGNPVRCADYHPSESLLNIHRNAQRKSIERREEPKPKREPLTIKTYIWFVLREGQDLSDDDINDKVASQMFVLNDAFAPAQISFDLQLTRVVHANSWVEGNDHENMMATVRDGDYTDLNLWFIDGKLIPGWPGAVGLTRYPIDLGKALAEQLGRKRDVLSDADIPAEKLDGCRIEMAQMPGGKMTGLATVHEVGHWFGLFHTFAGENCEGDGDFIDDTPQQATKYIGECPAESEANSCPDQHPGQADPIHNHMGYNSPEW